MIVMGKLFPALASELDGIELHHAAEKSNVKADSLRYT
jgi:hypothetical protein